MSDFCRASSTFLVMYSHVVESVAIAFERHCCSPDGRFSCVVDSVVVEVGCRLVCWVLRRMRRFLHMRFPSRVLKHIVFGRPLKTSILDSPFCVLGTPMMRFKGECFSLVVGSLFF